MATDESLKRLGGGRWETRDGRFAIEPQSGSWAVVDNSQTNEFGLPLVRGPYKSLTAAKEAIEEARTSGPAASPLTDQLRTARPSGSAAPKRNASALRRPEPKEAEPPPEPKWLRDLEPAERRRARDLVERLDSLGVDDAEAIAKAEVVRDQPAIARLALERRLAKATTGSETVAEAVQAAVDAILGGRDAELGVRWRLVDDEGRHINELQLPD